ncbi:MAG: hypothetical protein ABR961_14765 [Thermoanaerobaculaceae bacterium]|jgi:hypothetical protein
MRNARLALAGVVVVLVGSAAAWPPPPGPKPTATPTPQKVTMIPGAVHQPLVLPVFSVAGTLKQDPTVPTATRFLQTYRGPITFTANFDLYDVTFGGSVLADGPPQAGQLLGPCELTLTNMPSIATTKVNFKRGDTRTYTVSCSWPTGGPTPSYLGPCHGDLWAFYFLTDPPKTPEKSSGEYRLEMVK